MHIMGDKDTRPQARARRVHTAAFKRELVLRSLEPGASASAIALEAGVNANLLFGRRKKHLAGKPASATAGLREQAAVLLPVEVALPARPAVATTVQRSAAATGASGSIEIEVGDARVRVRGVVDEAALRNVLRVVRDNA